MPHENPFISHLVRAAASDEGNRRLSDHVPEPERVYYGVTPWVPAKDVTYAFQRESGAWSPPVPGVYRTLCDHCLDDPKAAGMDMCPGCHRFAIPDAEDRLANQRQRAAIFAGNAVPLTPDEPPAQTPESVLRAKWDDVTESKSHPAAKQDKQAKQAKAQVKQARRERAYAGSKLKRKRLQARQGATPTRSQP